jgi:hypothetical protein
VAKDLGLVLSEAGMEPKTTRPFYETNVKGCFAVGDADMQDKAVVIHRSCAALFLVTYVYPFPALHF